MHEFYNDTVSNNKNLNVDIKDNLKNNLSQEILNDASHDVSVKHHGTLINHDDMTQKVTDDSSKKRGFWSKFFSPND